MNAADPRPTVVAVHSNGKHDFSKTSKDSIRLIEGHGVEGDAHAGATDQHLFHIRQFGQTPNLRQVHLIQAELFEDLQTKGHIVKPGDLGENISTLGVNLLGLPAGARLRIGAEAVLEVTGLRNPCKQIENFQPGLLQHVVERDPTGLVRKAGVMSIVLKGGVVKPGDEITVELPPPPHQPLVYRMPREPIKRPAQRPE